MGKIDKELLEEFMFKFYGYGNLKSDYWFVGMEEGGGNTLDEIAARLKVWESHGKPTLMDNREFHKALHEEMGWKEFEKAWTTYQKTWGGLIKILLSYKNGIHPTVQEVKTFQATELGQRNSNTCIVELFPLPSPGIGKFHDFKSAKIEIDYLQDKDTYRSYLKQDRIDSLRNLIDEHEPKFVVFYSSTSGYVDCWNEIRGADDSDFTDEIIIVTKNKKKLTARFYKTKATCFVIIHHPTSHGVSNEYYKATGKRIKEILNS